MYDLKKHFMPKEKTNKKQKTQVHAPCNNRLNS